MRKLHEFPICGILVRVYFGLKLWAGLCAATAQEAGRLTDKASVCRPWFAPSPGGFILNPNPIAEDS